MPPAETRREPSLDSAPLFLASPAANYVNAHTLFADGGFTAK